MHFPVWKEELASLGCCWDAISLDSGNGRSGSRGYNQLDKSYSSYTSTSVPKVFARSFLPEPVLISSCK